MSFIITEFLDVGLRPLAGGGYEFDPAGNMDIYYECCLLSGRGLCVELITGPEESYRLSYVVV